MDTGPLISLPDLLIALQSGHLTAITAPLVLDDQVLVGFCNSAVGSGCVAFPLKDLPAVGLQLYVPTVCPIAVHGLKRIWEYLDLNVTGVKLDFVTDTKLMAYLLDPDLKEEGLTISNLSHVSGLGEYPHGILRLADENRAEAFSGVLSRDAQTAWDLASKLSAKMTPPLRRLYRHLELPLSKILHEMRQTGIGVDGQACARERARVQAAMTTLETQITGGQSVNLLSNAELFEFLSLKGVRFRNRYCYASRSVTAAELDEIAHVYPLVQQILEWRDLYQNIAFLGHTSGRNRIHAVWGQTRSGTSRIYARQPALQNVSRSLRYLFVPKPGHVLIKADYSQAQLRILAHLSGDDELLRLFRAGEDVHGETARWLGIDRNTAKQLNFGICFGMSAGALAGRINSIRQSQGLANIDEATAQTYIDGFYRRYPGVKAFFAAEWQKLKALPSQQRVVPSLRGRIRRFTGRVSSQLERRFRVTWPQQIEADLIKTAMVRLDTIFRRRQWGARIVMVIHDALWVEAPTSEEVQVRRLVEKMMTSAAKLRVPLTVEFE